MNIEKKINIENNNKYGCHVKNDHKFILDKWDK